MNDPTALALIGTALIALGWATIERARMTRDPRDDPKGDPR